MKWVKVSEKMPSPYQLVETRGTWKCSKVLYLDDEDDGWEQKVKGQIEVTHWRSRKQKKRNQNSLQLNN